MPQQGFPPCPRENSLSSPRSGKEDPKAQNPAEKFGFCAIRVHPETINPQDRLGCGELNNNETWEERETETENRNWGEIIEEKLAVPSSSCSTSSCSCNRRQSSLDMESSSSGKLFDEEDRFEFANVVRENGNDFDYGLRSNPFSPFRFVLHGSPSPDRKFSRVFSSLVGSPVRCKIEDNANMTQESPIKFEEGDEEDKEKNSPVSVLDPPFQDDDYDLA